ncbi:uncharacterized protein BDZ99DRAFT_457333 [Mytilinidion resinicola]|uniref:Uncharacterized protein n=1 Tax=Mytilinidion resinicola TaxID=574789 RepID=A0A6A6ZA88_9PEZI|nr:uncharacterized protein BDZ99DRAFT_457333 [Mytilinidion resinicola]KAF2817609.1 hypothetical protein BDZ99DRAFT_457333 [Mytilinidion resinicola]
MSAPATLPASPHHVFRDREATGTPAESPARRVLAELTPKAINAATNNNAAVEHLEALKNRSPLKQVQTLSPARQMDTENMSELQYPGLGRKRPITEVDGAVAREDGLGCTYRAFDERDGSLRQAFRPGVIARMRENQSTSAVNLGGDDSEEDVLEGEAQVSQETNQSFSSMINYNPDRSSSQTRVSPPATEVPEPPPSVNTSNTKVLTERQQRAEALRLRLRMAMYKVHTNQTDIPLADLKLPTPVTTTPLSEPSTKLSTLTTEASISTAHTSLSTSLTSTTSTVPSITFSPALSSPTSKPPTKPQLLPAPVLLPTAYSSRFITESGIIPSSPPGSVSPAQTHIHPPEDLSPSHDSFVTPMAQRRAFEQLSSPPGSGERDMGELTTSARANRRFEEGDLTSSVVKGRAASGLIDLMNSVRR